MGRRTGLSLLAVMLALALAWVSGAAQRAHYFFERNGIAALWEKLREDGVRDTAWALYDKVVEPDSIPTLRFSLADRAAWPPGDDALERAKLPASRVIPALAAQAAGPARGGGPDHQGWGRSHGNAHSDKFSDLQQITPANVAGLQLAWVHRSGAPLGDARQIGPTVQTNPVFAAGRLFVTDTEGHLIALDAGTGHEVWRRELPGPVARRGLVWDGEPDLARSRLYVPTGRGVFAVRASDGAIDKAFGEQGQVGEELSLIAPLIVGRHLVIATAKPALEAYDLTTGRRVWRRRLLDKLERRPGAYLYGGVPWSGMSGDSARGTVYVATGNPRPQLVGTTRLGDNRNACSVVAVQADTGEVVWAFQEVSHDLWDLDIPAPPVLTTIERDGRRIDVVAAVTKLGNTLVLDRDTGRPMFDYRQQRAPPSTLPGERSAAYQPAVELPQPFTQQTFGRGDITDLSPAARSYVEHKLRDARHGWFQPPVLGGTVAAFGLQGGAEWPGAAVDPRSSTLYLPSNQIPWLIRVNLQDVQGTVEEAAALPGHALYLQRCAACHQTARQGTWQGEREGDLYHPSLVGITFLRSRAQLLSTEAFQRAHAHAQARSGAPAAPEPTPTPTPTPTPGELTQLHAYFAAMDTTADRRRSFVMDAYWQLLLDDQGHPGSKPPWGHLTAIDLNTGRQRWQIPFGAYDDLRRQGQPVRGQRNTGGVIATASGLLFATGTVDDRVRAFAAADGSERWSYRLPAAGSAPPSTYWHQGVQYLVVVATGGSHIGFSGRSDQILAFRLPPVAGAATSAPLR